MGTKNPRNDLAMSGDKFERRYDQRRDDSLESLKQYLNVHVFGPYGGACSYILKAMTGWLRDQHNCSANLCVELPEMESIRDRSETKSEYNYKASIECMERADRGVFVFMEPKPSRFADPDAHSFAELNSSVIVELTMWIHDYDYSKRKSFVIFEGDIRDGLGSLIDGLVRAEGVNARDIETSSREETINSFTDAIDAQIWNWVQEAEPILRERAERTDGQPS